MKVLLATPLYPPDTGGPATDTVVLEKELPTYEIITETLSFGRVRHMPKGIRHIHYFFLLLKKARHKDCIIALDTFSVCLPALCAAKILRKPLIVRVPGDYAWEQGVQRFGVTDTIEIFQTKRYGFLLEMIRTLQKFALKHATHVVVPSDFLKNIVTEWGVPSEKLTRVYLGIPLSEEILLPKNVPEGKIIFSLGRLVPWKGFSMIIELMKDLSDEWYVVIAGEGPLRKELELLATTLGVSPRVTFLGPISHAEVLGWFRRADVFVQNTSQETFSFQVLEALAAGVPIVTTRVGPIPELITDGIEGVLCSPNDKKVFTKAIVSVVDEPDVWRTRSIAARKRAENFSSEKSVHDFVSKVMKIYE